jgi:type IV secretion system protein TrbC
MKLKQKIERAFAALITIFILPVTAFAGTTGSYPWDKPLNDFGADLTSTTAMILAIIAFAFCGLCIAFGDLQGGSKKAFYVGIGISIVVGAPSLITHIGGHVGGAIIF